jgi:dihydrofolate reductase
MRTLIVTEFIALDGVIDSPGGDDGHPHAGWTFRDVAFDPAAYELKGREQSEATALLVGRRSYELFAPVWGSMAEFAEYNAMPRYVVSRSLETDNPAWPATILRSIDEVAALRAGEGGPIIVHASSKLAQSLAAADLVDRYHLLVFPVVLGSGNRLWGETDDAYAKLTLVEQEAYPNGIVKLVYDVRRDT